MSRKKDDMVGLGIILPRVDRDDFHILCRKRGITVSEFLKDKIYKELEEQRKNEE